MPYVVKGIYNPKNNRKSEPGYIGDQRDGYWLACSALSWVDYHQSKYTYPTIEEAEALIDSIKTGRLVNNCATASELKILEVAIDAKTKKLSLLHNRFFVKQVH